MGSIRMNRLRGISDNGYVSLYWYDADGNRTVKEHQGGEAVWVNGTAAGANTDSVSYSIYPNPYISISGDRWTKHYYIGAERIASRTGTISNFSALNSMQNLPAGDGIMDSVVYSTLRHAQEDSVASMYAQLGVPYQVRRTTTRGEGAHLYFPITRTGEDVDGDSSAGTSDINQQRNHPSTLGDGQVYFYLRDHLGSTLSVTDSVGNYAQQVEYTPWGEVFVERQIGSSGHETPFLFNGKELDEETGLYYYGARYYDPKMSVWYSVDPLSNYNPLGNENHLDGEHNGGVYNQANLNSYIYCYDSPVKYLDPNGEQVVAVHGTWSYPNTWKQPTSIFNFAHKIFGNNDYDYFFRWSGGNYKSMRSEASTQLIDYVRKLRKVSSKEEPITFVGHSHGGNVVIEAINKMVSLNEFDDVVINLITINTPVRSDYQLGTKALGRVKHVNIYDPKDPVQICGGNSVIVLPFEKTSKKFTGEYGHADRTFNNAVNISVDKPQGIMGDFHNSHNRVNDWNYKLDAFPKE